MDDVQKLIDELRAAQGDSPEDMDWTEELFSRAADALLASKTDVEAAIRLLIPWGDN